MRESQQVSRLRENRIAAGIVFLLLALLFSAMLLRWLQWTRHRPVPISIGTYLRQFFSASMLTMLTAGNLLFFAPAVAGTWLGDTPRRPRQTKLVVTILILTYIVAFGYFTFQRHYHFGSAGFDLGIQVQAVWNTSQGRWYGTSLEIHNYLGDHLQPLLALLAPFYYWSPTPYWLLGFQTITLSLGAIPVYRLASRRLNSPVAGVVFAAAYLLYPSVGFINRFDFHWEATVIVLFLAAVDAADTGNWRLMSLWLLLALLGKEEIGLTVATFGLWLALRRNYRPGLLWALGGVAFSLVALFVIIPAFRMAPSDTLGRYAWLGSSPIAMVRNLLTQPVLVASHLFQRQTLSLFLSLLGPLLFLPLLSSQTLVVIPAIAYNLLSALDAQHTIYFQYVAPIVPFLVSGAIYGADNLQRWSENRKEIVWLTYTGVFVFSLWHVTALHNPLVDNGLTSPAWMRLANEEAVRSGLEYVPAESALFTSNHYVPHLAHRREVYTYIFQEDINRIVQSEALFLNLLDQRSVVAPLNCNTYRQFLEQAQEKDFGVVFEETGVLVLLRNKEWQYRPLEPDSILQPYCAS